MYICTAPMSTLIMQWGKIPFIRVTQSTKHLLADLTKYMQALYGEKHIAYWKRYWRISKWTWRSSISWVRRLVIVEMQFSPNISVKSVWFPQNGCPTEFFMGLDTLIQKLTWKSKRSKKVMKFPVKMNKIRWFALPDIKTNIKLWKLCDTGLDEQTSGIE